MKYPLVFECAETLRPPFGQWTEKQEDENAVDPEGGDPGVHDPNKTKELIGRANEARAAIDAAKGSAS
jgi:hypothetical protein